MKKGIVLLFLFAVILLVVGCTAADPFPEDIYFGDVYSNGVLLVPGVGVGDMTKAVYDPANINQQLVGLTAAQSLTNKNLTMNNNVPIYWKDTFGANVEVFNLWLDDNLDIFDGEHHDIFIWGGSGTGHTMFLWPTGSTAGATLRDSPTIDFIANYWDALNKNWEAKVIHDMITAGATPKSQLKFSINGASILRLENDNGTVKTFSDGVLDMTTHQINNVVDPTLAQDAATKYYVDNRYNYAGMHKHESAAATPIQQINDWTLVNGWTTGYVGGGWSFHTGGQLAITAFADNGDGKTKITVAGHVLVNGDIISISDTTSYDGVWIVEQIVANTFVIPTAWVADEGAKTGEHGSHFHSATATSTGKYLVMYNLSVKPLSANCVIECSVYYNATQEIKSESETKLGAITDSQNVSGFSIVDVTVNGIVSLGVRNITDAGDFLIRDGNMALVKID